MKKRFILAMKYYEMRSNYTLINFVLIVQVNKRLKMTNYIDNRSIKHRSITNKATNTMLSVLFESEASR